MLFTVFFAVKLLCPSVDERHTPRRRWEDNIKINLRETRLGGIEWIHLANPYSRIVALGSTQSLTELSTRNLPGGRG
jgi:hypothetical protein